MTVEKIIVSMDNRQNFNINLTGNIKNNVDNIYLQIYNNQECIKVRNHGKEKSLTTLKHIHKTSDKEKIEAVKRLYSLVSCYQLDEILDVRLSIFGDNNAIRVSINSHHLNSANKYLRVKLADEENLIGIADFIELLYMSYPIKDTQFGNIIWLNDDRLKIDKRKLDSRIDIETI